MASPDGLAALVLGPGGNLVSSRDPDQIVATLWQAQSATAFGEPIMLRALMDPADMPQTTSHYAWLCNWNPDTEGWTLALCDDRTVTVRYPTAP